MLVFKYSGGSVIPRAGLRVQIFFDRFGCYSSVSFLFVFVKNFSPYFCFSSILLTYLYCDLEIELNMIESCTAIPFR